MRRFGRVALLSCAAIGMIGNAPPAEAACTFGEWRCAPWSHPGGEAATKLVQLRGGGIPARILYRVCVDQNLGAVVARNTSGIELTIAPGSCADVDVGQNDEVTLTGDKESRGSFMFVTVIK